MTYHGHINIDTARDVKGRGMVMAVRDFIKYSKGDTFYYGEIWEIIEVDIADKLVHNKLGVRKELTVRKYANTAATFPLAATPREVPIATHAESRRLWLVIIVLLLLFWGAVIYMGCE